MGAPSRKEEEGDIERIFEYDEEVMIVVLACMEAAKRTRDVVEEILKTKGRRRKKSPGTISRFRVIK